MREYNPEGSCLRRDQKEMLKVLEAFAEICSKHDIKWWLCSGTLLGAARHGGFIPWDDDIDVSMMKSEYKKLEKILLESESDDYFFQCMKSDIEHINMFGKFRKKKDPVMSTDVRSGYFKYQGLGLDVFSIEKSSRFASHLAKFFYLNMQHPTQYIKNKRFRRFMIRTVEILNRFIFMPLSRLVGLINPEGDYHYELGSGFYDQAFHVEEIFPLSEIEFEGVKFPAPGNVDAYLTRIYGDWRKLPSDDQIRESLHYPVYIEEIFGKEE